MNKTATIILAVAIPIALILGVAVGWFIPRLQQKSAESQPAASAPAEEAKEPGHIQLKPDQLKNANLQFIVPPNASLTPEIQCFGVLQEDPADSFTIRAQLPGVLQTSGTTAWPNLGDTLADNGQVGLLLPRIVTADEIALDTQRTALQTQLTAAQADLNTAQAALAAAQAAYTRLKALNAQDQNVSDRVVEEAQAKVKTEEAHVAGAEKNREESAAALKQVQAKQAHLPPIPLVTSRGGEVVEVNAHPGEAIEAGQPILRVARFQHLVAAVTVLPGDPLAPEVKDAKIFPLGATPESGKAVKPLIGVRLGNAELTDPKTHGRTLLFRIEQLPTGTLRPGAPITATLLAQGQPLRGVVIPDSAVVRYQGKAWIYVADDQEKDAGEFLRKEIPLDHPTTTSDGQPAWLFTEKFDSDDNLVSQGAATLLSTEITASFGGGE